MWWENDHNPLGVTELVSGLHDVTLWGSSPNSSVTHDTAQPWCPVVQQSGDVMAALVPY